MLNPFCYRKTVWPSVFVLFLAGCGITPQSNNNALDVSPGGLASANQAGPSDPTNNDAPPPDPAPEVVPVEEEQPPVDQPTPPPPTPDPAPVEPPPPPPANPPEAEKEIILGQIPVEVADEILFIRNLNLRVVMAEGAPQGKWRLKAENSEGVRWDVVLGPLMVYPSTGDLMIEGRDPIASNFNPNGSPDALGPNPETCLVEMDTITGATSIKGRWVLRATIDWVQDGESKTHTVPKTVDFEIPLGG